ncbi:JAB domain-containing protein [Sorangium sp. So ce118]
MIASSFVLCDNHSNGGPRPTDEDVELTNAVERAAHLIGVWLPIALSSRPLGASPPCSAADSGPVRRQPGRRMLKQRASSPHMDDAAEGPPGSRAHERATVDVLATHASAWLLIRSARSKTRAANTTLPSLHPSRSA